MSVRERNKSTDKMVDPWMLAAVMPVGAVTLRVVGMARSAKSCGIDEVRFAGSSCTDNEQELCSLRRSKGVCMNDIKHSSLNG